MKKPLLFIAFLSVTLFYAYRLLASEAPAIPMFPLNADGRIELKGSGTSLLTRAEMMPLLLEWMYTDIDADTIVEDAGTGTVTAEATFVIAADQLWEGTRSVEFMEYLITVTCRDNTYSYVIGDVNVYVTTALWPGGFAAGTDISYDVVDISSIDMPSGYIALIDSYSRERSEIRERLESLLSQDMESASRGKVRRHERELEQTAGWFAAIDEYYRVALENYAACYDYLAGLPVSLSAALEGGTEEVIQLEEF